MKISKEHIELLIIDKLSGQISTEDNTLLEYLIENDDEVKEIWKQSEDILLRYKVQKYANYFDGELAWQKISTKIQPKKISSKRFFKLSHLVAASILLPFLLGIYWLIIFKNKVDPATSKHHTVSVRLADGTSFYLDKNQINIGGMQFGKSLANSKINSAKIIGRKNEIVTLSIPKGETYSVILEDSTVVRLNSSSVLKFPLFFEENIRRVELKGEAFFEVTKQQGKSFVVSTDNIDIKVLGTKFNVNSYPGSTHQTSLLEGSVEVHDLYSDIFKMIKPGQAAIKPDLTDMVIEPFERDKVLSWLNGVYYFNDIPLRDIVKLVNRVRKEDLLIVNSELSNYHFSGVLYANQPISVLLENLKTSYPLVKYENKGGKIVLY